MRDDVARQTWKRRALHALVESLGRIDELATDANRTMLIGLIEDDLRVEEPAASLPVPRNSVRRLDLLALTHACLQIRGGVRALRAAATLMFGRSGQVAGLLSECDRLLELEPGLLADEDRAVLRDVLNGIALSGRTDVPSLFVEATEPVPMPATVSTVEGAVRQLEGRGTAVPLMRFLALLATHSNQNRGVAALRSWIDAHLDIVPEHRRAEVTRLSDADSGVADHAEAKTSLLVRVEPLEDDTYSVMAWLGQTDSAFGPNEGPEDVVTLDELKQWLRDFVRKYRRGALNPVRHPLIEFALPPSHLNEPVDTWPMDGGERLGVLYQVTVRPLSRSDSALALLGDRWKALVAGAGAGQPAPGAVRWLNSTVIFAADDPDHPAWAWIAVTCPFIGYRATAVDALLATGTPVAVWLRGDQTPVVRRTVLEGLSRGRLVTQFPDAVRKFRENGWQDESDDRDLVLLWDDPTRQPPSSYLVNAPERRT